MLSDTNLLLKEAQLHKYAVPAFNVFNLETVQAAIHVAERESHPVIIALGERYFSSVDVEGFAELVKTLARKSSAPVALHLDHAYGRDSIIRAIRNGFTSVMYDGSKYSLNENIRRTKDIVHIAHAVGVSVEAEIGSVARGAFSDEEDGDGRLTNPTSAKEFVDSTGVDFLAPAIGTVHGMYKGEPNVNLKLLADIRESVHVPLVLHGGSGTPEGVLKQSIELGICKVNVNTEVSVAAVSYLSTLALYELPHLSTVMIGVQNSMEQVMTKFVRLFKNR